MLTERVVWTEGLQLCPVHFQQQDRYTESQLAQRGLLLPRYGWGFTEFVIDEQYLNLGKVVLSKAQGILPDGSLFEIGHGQEGLSLDVEPGVMNRQVVLALPIALEGSSEIREEKNTGLSTRYVAHAVTVRSNIAADTRERAIQCARPDLKLMFADDVSQNGYVILPILHIVECRPDKSILADKDFTPTFMHMGASPLLSGYLRELIGLISHRADQLARRISSAGSTGTAEIADFMLLQCLNRAEPVFKHLDTTPNVTPEDCYLQLLSLVGELASYVEAGKRPGDLPRYNHRAQYQCFTDLMELARFALSMVLEQHAVELPLQQRKYGITVSPIHDRNLLTAASFILVASADMDQETLRTSLPRQLKIGTVENIRDLVNRQLPGIRIAALAVAPRQIPFHAGKSYFHLEFTSEELAQMELSGGFAFYVSGTFPGLQLQFWAIKE
ncbi:type VI secretion system baseplate subunit TssK [uncultured Desulfovibrio sp.]|uniref:type VI secretion system baseplate subunit TssK n=1 Tax=uncultured Desulfovibrio sp. TaxID=167968 RepID=UPI00262C7A11|nr:type VI secretion system baseplate subunit TssK [uncultured Desulfovibrio sp.]